jgi:hypothetical protein
MMNDLSGYQGEKDSSGFTSSIVIISTLSIFFNRSSSIRTFPSRPPCGKARAADRRHTYFRDLVSHVFCGADGFIHLLDLIEDSDTCEKKKRGFPGIASALFPEVGWRGRNSSGWLIDGR